MRPYDEDAGYRLLFDHVTSGVAVLEAAAGPRFVFREVNEAFLRIVGLPRDEVEGRPLEEALPGVRTSGLLGVLAKVWETGVAQAVPASLYRDDRIRFWAEHSVYRLPTGEVVAVCDDTTDRKRAEEQRQFLDERLRHSQKLEAVGVLAGGIAHDFNNILAIIAYNAEIVLHHELPPDSPARHGIGQILEATSRGRDLIQQVLSFSRPEEAGRRVVRLGYLAKDALRLLRVTTPKGVEFHQRTTAKRDEVLANPSQLLQVVVNLCTNAIHAVGDGSGILSVTLAEAVLEPAEAGALGLEPGDYLRFTVADTGHGMPPEVLARVFDPYFTTKPRGRGEGMGLAVAHGIVTSHGGAIAAQSEVGKGSTFQVLLPRCSGAAEALDSHPDAERLLGTGRVLLVDDEEPITLACGRLLRSLGWAVVTASNGAEALRVLRSDPEAFDLLIADYAMPRMTGIEFVSEVRMFLPGLPVILCTGYAEAATPERLRVLGIREILPKPVRRGELIAALNRALEPASPAGAR